MPGESQQEPLTGAPDPSVLTTEQMLREVENAEQRFDAKFDAITMRLDGIDRATALLHDDMTRFPTEVQQEIGHLKELTDVRLKASNDITGLREAYRLEFKADSEKALAAALIAAEKAVQCVTMDTLILCADLVWRPAGDLLVGDELIAFDEDAQDTPRGRRFRRAVVTGNTPKRDALVRVTTSHGTIRCNRRHPFLARFPKERWRWLRAEDLTPNEQVMFACDVWDQDRSWSAGWLAGMYDGEGSLSFTNSKNGKARLSIVQSLGPTADLMAAEIKDRCESAQVRLRLPPAAHPNYKSKTEIQIDARVDIMRMLGSVRPQRLLVNSDRVWEDFPISGNGRAATVMSVESEGTGMVASLSTSTGTYIAAGFAVHNTALAAAEKARDQQTIASQLATDKSELRLIDAQAQMQQTFTVALANVVEGLNETKEGIAELRNLKRGGEANTAGIYAFVGFLGTGLIILTVLLANGFFSR